MKKLGCANDLENLGRFAIFTDTYIPDPNGVAISAQRQFQTLLTSGIPAELYCPEHLEVVNPIPAVKIFDTIDSTYSLYVPRKLPSFSRKTSEKSIVHVHTPFSFGLLGLFEARRRNAKSIYTHHTNFFNDYMHYLGQFNNRYLAGILLRSYRAFILQFDLVIAPSITSKEYLQQKLKIPSHRIYLLPTPSFLASSSASCESLSRDIDVIYVSRLAPEKNVNIAIASLLALVAARPCSRIVIVGDGVAREHVVSTMGIATNPAFSCYRKITNSEVQKLLLRSKVLLFTSLSDTQGLVIDEAQACGTYTVAVDSPLTRERISVGQNGWLTLNKAQDIASTLASVLDFPLMNGGVRSGTLSQSQWMAAYTEVIRGLYG
jgi:1,2-diacylglycerol 3-alpha-glucosyltransferase